MPKYITMLLRPKGNVVQVYPTIPSARVVCVLEFVSHEQWDIPNIKTKILQSMDIEIKLYILSGSYMLYKNQFPVN